MILLTGTCPRSSAVARRRSVPIHRVGTDVGSLFALALCLNPLIAACTDSTTALGDARQSDAGSAEDAGPDDGDTPIDSGRDAGMLDGESADLGAPDLATGCGAPESPPAPLCGAACGNGVRNECEQCGGPNCGRDPIPDAGGGRVPPPFDAGACCAMVLEPCDITDLAGQSCESLGFTGGTLGCSSSCELDTTGCTSCSITSISFCTEVAVDAKDASAIAIAATEDGAAAGEVALIWVAGRAGAPGSRLRFARLESQGLSLIGESSGCFGPAGARRVSLAAITGGWLAAVEHVDGMGSYGIDLLPIDGSGNVGLGGSTIEGAFAPVLVESEMGALPLLLYSTYPPAGDGPRTFARSFDRNLGSIFDTALFDRPIGEEFVRGVFVGDGFVVGARTARGVEIRRVGLDGIAGPATAVDTANTEYPSLDWNGSAGRISWARFGGPLSLAWATFDQNGRPGGVEVLSADSATFNPAPLAMRAGGIAVLVEGYSGATDHARWLDLDIRDADGRPTGSRFRIAQDPSLLYQPRMLKRRGIETAPDSLIAWLRPAPHQVRIGLARVVR